MDEEPKPPGLLMTLLTGERSDLELVRRRIGHRRLVLLPHPGTEPLAEEVQRREGSDAVAVAPLPPADVNTHLARLRTILDQEKNRQHAIKRIVLQAAGGDPGRVMAMILFAYEQGHETWFSQEGHHVKLPVLRGIRMRNRLEKQEEEVLQALPTQGTRSSDLAQQIIQPRERIERALRSLEKKDLVTLYPQGGRVAARPTATGRYLKEHLEASEQNRPGTGQR